MMKKRSVRVGAALGGLVLLACLSSCSGSGGTDETGEPDDGIIFEYEDDDNDYNDFLPIVYSERDGTTYYIFNADIDVPSRTGIFPYAYIRVSSGTYYTDSSYPEFFSAPDRRFIGKRPEPGEYTIIRSGDTVNGMLISDAKTVIPLAPRYYGNSEASTITKYISLSGEAALTGTLRYYAGEKYGIAGELTFIPDSSYLNFPDPTSWFRGYINIGTTDPFADDSGNVLDGELIYTDAPEFILGSYADNKSYVPALGSLIGSGSKSLSVNVSVTLSDISIVWDALIGCRAHAKLVSLFMIDNA